MEWIDSVRHHFFTPEGLQAMILAWGLPVLVAIIFCETSLFVGFWLPGDWLLFMVGVLAAGGHFDLVTLWIALSTAAIAGDALGFWIGERTGRAIYRRPDGWIFKRKYLLQTREFYERHGGKTIVMARFVPVIRTFAPVVAGVAGMEYRRFAAFNIAGGVGWIVGLTSAGYFLGQIAWVRGNLEKMVLGIIVLSITPLIIEYVKHRRREAARVPTSVLPVLVLRPVTATIHRGI